MNLTAGQGVFAALLLMVSLAQAQTGISAVTSPSADVTLSFVQAGRVAEVLVKEGDTVGDGQVVVKLDDSVEQLRLVQIKAQAEDTSQLQAAQASLDQKRLDLKRIDWAAQKGAATDLELEHARLDVLIAELSLKVAVFESQQNQRRYDEAKCQLARMQLKSPIGGIVEKLHVEPGESVNGLADVVRIVRIDPLWIDVHVPIEQASALTTGRTATVTLPGPSPAASKGTVTFVSVVADSASSTLRCRIELPNPARRPAGERVEIRFDKPAGQPKGPAQ